MRPLLQYSERYRANIGHHVFPMEKYGLVIESLTGAGIITSDDIAEPAPATIEDALLVHTRGYLDAILMGTLSPDDLVRLEIPFSEEVVDAFFLAAGGTIAALRSALERGVGINVGGGFHHAYPDHAEGFCLLNDVAIGVARVLADGAVKRVAVIDCDVHQGNGTAVAFSHDERVFTLSIHQENNYPLFKPPSSLDIPIADWTEGPLYLALLEEGLPHALDEFRPEAVVYVAGADPFEHDVLGGLQLTADDLADRDAMIMTACTRLGIPFAVTLAGGYASRLSDTVSIHAATVAAAIAAGEAFPGRTSRDLEQTPSSEPPIR